MTKELWDPHRAWDLESKGEKSEEIAKEKVKEKAYIRAKENKGEDRIKGERERTQDRTYVDLRREERC